MASKQQNDCSGVISAIAFGVFCVLGSLLLFYIMSGPPTFLEVEVMAPGSTLFHNFTWSRLWCECVKFENVNNHSASDISLWELSEPPNVTLSSKFDYEVEQTVADEYASFEFWEAYFHPGAVATANFSFSEAVTFYLAPRYYVDGLQRDPDYADHHVMKWTNVTEGVVHSPPFNVSGGWAFVWEKDFKVQKQTRGVVHYSFHMIEYALPTTGRRLTGSGELCWAPHAEPTAWFLAASRSAELHVKPRLQASMWCVPRYKLTVPITAIPVTAAVILEILIIVFCIVRPRRKRQAERYVQI